MPPANEDKMHNPTVRHSHVSINNSFVHLVQYGGVERLLKSTSLSDANDSQKSSPKQPRNNHTSNSTNRSHAESNGSYTSSYNGSTKKLIVFLPGNPGVLGIYHDFLVAFYKSIYRPSGRADEQPTILAISHNNFDHPDYVDYKSDSRVCVEENDLNFVEKSLAQTHSDEPHHIELQVMNKIIILKRLLNINIDDCGLIFIGHSIGCYIILRLLQDRVISNAHEGSVMIHPALENLASTEKGSFYDWMLGHKMDLLVRTAAVLVEKLLPKSAKLAIAKWICSPDFVQSSSEIVLDSVVQLSCSKTLSALIQMAKSEFALVKDINADLMIKPHAAKLKMIYAINDHWVNSDNRNTLRELYPNLYMEEQSTKHAFVMDPKTVMDYAVKVGMFVQDFLDNID